jgi:hypothetical protein
MFLDSKKVIICKWNIFDANLKGTFVHTFKIKLKDYGESDLLDRRQS